MIERAEKFAAEMLRLAEGRAVYTDMLDWAFSVWPVHKERDPAEIAKLEFRNAAEDD